MVSKEQKETFIQSVHAAPNGNINFHMGLDKSYSETIRDIFARLQEEHPVPEVELEIHPGIYKDSGKIREGWHDYKNDKIAIFLESIYYTFCRNTTMHESNPELDEREWQSLMVNTVAHEYYHAIQKKLGKNMSGSSRRIEREADRFSQKFTKKYLGNK